MLASNGETSRKVFNYDVYLSSVDMSSQIHKAFGGLFGMGMYRQSMSRAFKFSMQESVGDLRHRRQKSLEGRF